jgi:hypothetical protein
VANLQRHSHHPILLGASCGVLARLQRRRHVHLDPIVVSWRFPSLSKQVSRPAHEQVEEQHHEDDDRAPADENHAPVEPAELQLTVDGPLLQVEGLLGDATVLREMLAPCARQASALT